MPVCLNVSRRTLLPVCIILLLITASCNIDPVSVFGTVPLSRPHDVIVRLIPPPGKSSIGFSGAPLKALIEHPELWTQTRERIDYLGFYSQYLGNPDIFTAEELRRLFDLINDTPGLEFSLEVGVLRPWHITGEHAFEVFRLHWNRIESNGGVISMMAIDETLRSALFEIDGYTIHDAVRETADWIVLVRERYPSPDFLIGSTEPMPMIRVSILIDWIEMLNAECASRGVRGLDFFVVDPDWTPSIRWDWVLEVEEYCDSIDLPFSIIYWPSAHTRPTHTDEGFYDDIHYQGDVYRSAGGTPDIFTIMSWDYIPYKTVPETEPYSFTYSFLSFYNVFIAESKCGW